MEKNSLEQLKPVLAMVGVQSIYAGNALLSKVVFNQGMNPYVFIVYRQAIAALVMAPTSLARWGSSSRGTLGLQGFAFVFLVTLIGATINQVLYLQGLRMASSSVASAVCNLVPAITFLMAVSLGLEKVSTRSLRSMAKVCGTLLCVGGAMFMAFFKGHKLLNLEPQTPSSNLHAVSGDWMIGCFFLLGSGGCWSLWLILQVSLCKHYLDPMSLSNWMCFLSSIQSAVLTCFLEPDLRVWKLHSSFELLCCLYGGIINTAVTYCVQSWCLTVRGPLFCAMFNPVCTVIVTILACPLIHEELYSGSLIGAVGVVLGLYTVLWGKAKDPDNTSEPDPKDNPSLITITADEKWEDHDTDMKEPLLIENTQDAGSQV